MDAESQPLDGSKSHKPNDEGSRFDKFIQHVPFLNFFVEKHVQFKHFEFYFNNLNYSFCRLRQKF